MIPNLARRTMTLPGFGLNALTRTPTPTLAFPTGPVTITYVYDPFNRLTEANYSDGRFYHYTYDKVGNRLSVTDQSSTITYTYDVANRLTSVDGVPYTYDNNGNLLSNGTTTYTYDFANRLISASNDMGTTIYAYSGLGERLQMTVNGVTTTFTMDLASGLSQVLDDGTNAYLYGYGRIAQASATDTQYFLTDALGSVRQMTDANGVVTLAQNFDPYGVAVQSSGAGSTRYGFDGEQVDSSTGMIYLRARYYMPGDGRFLTRDTWSGSANQPMSYNRWMYAYGNPVNLSDPTGMRPNLDSYCDPLTGASRLQCQKIVRGLNPTNSMSTIDISIFDNFGGNYQCEPLFKVMNLPGKKDNGKVSESYGFWFHYLLNKKSKSGPVSISTVIAYVLSAETNVGPKLYSKIMPEVVKAMMFKSQATGAYNAIGSRQAAQEYVNRFIFFQPVNEDWPTRIRERNEPDGKGGGCGTRWGTGTYECSQYFETIIQETGRDWESELKLDLQNKVEDTLLLNFDISGGSNNIPDDWGNVTPDSLNMPLLKDALYAPYDPDKYSFDSNSVYWRTAPPSSGEDKLGQFFITTVNQRSTLCKGFSSCVKR